MKDFCLRLVRILLVTVSVATFCSCDGDDDDRSDNPDHGGGFISTKDRKKIDNLKSKLWLTNDYSFGFAGDDHAWIDDDTDILIFSSDTEGLLYRIEKDYDTALGNTQRKSERPFSYYVDGDYVNIRFTNDLTHLLLKYQDSYLGSLDGVYYYGKDITSGDRDWLKSVLPIKGKCGAGMDYTYFQTSYCLEFDGTGDMFDYQSSDYTPWANKHLRLAYFMGSETSVGDNAFANTMLEEVGFYGDVAIKRFGKRAFANTFITEIVFPNSLKEVDDGAFANCRYLKNIHQIYGLKLQRLGDYAFMGCDGLKGSSFFFDCAEIGRDVFNCKLGNLYFEEGVRSIGIAAFGGGCTNKEIVLPNTVESVGSLAFSGPFNKVILGTGIKTIGSQAFDGAETGSLYINTGTPPQVSGLTPSITGNDNYWTLYVPAGCKAAYSAASPWNNFKIIIEDSSLSGEPGTIDTDDDDKPVDEPTTDNDWTEPLTYQTGGNTYRMIKVESASGTVRPFRMMQTELPIDKDLTVNGKTITKLDRNGDGHVIKSELKLFIDDLREMTGVPFRLPTANEWMFAAKGGDKSSNYKYSGSNTLSNVGWYEGNSGKKAHDVALLMQNELGFYDMSGNMAEVVNNGSDLYHIDGPIYGGCWKDSSSDCTTSSYKDGVISGKIPGSSLKEKNAFDGRYNTIRLVFTCKGE